MVINCFRLNAMSSQSSYVGKKKKKKLLIPKVLVLGSGVFRRWLGHEVEPSGMGLVLF